MPPSPYMVLPEALARRSAAHPSSGPSQRPGQGALGFGNKLRFVPADEIGADNDNDDRRNADDNDHRSGKPFHLASEQIGGESEKARPAERADDVGHHEMPPRHAIGPGQNASDAAQHRYEAGDEDDLAAMAQEQIFAELDAAF